MTNTATAFADFPAKTATQIKYAIATGDMTAVGVIDELLEHIANVDETVAAWIHLNADAARASARALDAASGGAGVLHGVLRVVQQQRWELAWCQSRSAHKLPAQSFVQQPIAV